MQGTVLLPEAVKKYPLQSRILISAYCDKTVMELALQKCEIFAYLEKPWNDAVLKETIL